MKSLKNPMTNAIYIALITAIYAIIFIVSSEFVFKYDHFLSDSRWSLFIQNKNMKYVGLGMIGVAIIIDTFSALRRKKFDEYQIITLEKVDVAIIATIILLTGKGSMLVTGFNTKNAEELTKYDVKKVSRQAGIFMTLIDFGLIGLVSYIQFRAVPAIQDNTISNYGTEITVVSLGICIYILFVAIIATTRGFKNCKK